MRPRAWIIDVDLLALGYTTMSWLRIDQYLSYVCSIFLYLSWPDLTIGFRLRLCFASLSNGHTQMDQDGRG